MRKIRMPRKKEIKIGTCKIFTHDEARKKKLELQIAKKNYEVEVLKIELKYPEGKKSEGKIGFKV